MEIRPVQEVVQDYAGAGDHHAGAVGGSQTLREADHVALGVRDGHGGRVFLRRVGDKIGIPRPFFRQAGYGNAVAGAPDMSLARFMV